MNAPAALQSLIESVFPGATIVDVTVLGTDEGKRTRTATGKTLGYGVPVRITLTTGGARQIVVLHTASPNDFGHDRRADRADQLLLAYDTFDRIPRHVVALDVGTITYDGQYRSLSNSDEFYLLTTYAPGEIYADDLRRIAHSGLEANDVLRCELLARYLADVHTVKGERPAIYRRAIRDLVGHGEGIFGIIDGYPDDVPGAPHARLQDIEAHSLEWRWRLAPRHWRLTRTHGDFHPFNVLFDEANALSVLDASRGCEGDPADDVSCMAINYVFFALQSQGAWQRGLRDLWYRFFRTYTQARPDAELFEVMAPFLAWRILVLASPRWYPDLAADPRNRLLGLAERALDAPRFDPAMAEALFTTPVLDAQPTPAGHPA